MSQSVPTAGRPVPKRTGLSLIPALLAAALTAGCARSAPQVPEAAGTVAGETITVAQVDARVQEVEPEAWQALYEARRRALEALIDERLLAGEARRTGVEADSLVERQVEATVAAVSDSQVQDFYERNRGRMGGQPLEVVREAIRDYLVAGSRQQARQAYLAGLRSQAGVAIALEPPRARFEIDGGERAKGSVEAPIQLVEYSDFECPYCGRAQPAVREVLATYGDRVLLVYRDFPLSMHEHAHLAAQAGQCAHEQGRFWEYHDVLFANASQLAADDLKRHAAAAGLDPAAFAACLDSGRTAPGVDADLESGAAQGVSGTPAFFINGLRLSGAQPFAAFQQVIDDELRRLGAAD